MTNLKKNIDYYMQIKGIKNYTNLLIDIARNLGIRGQEAYEFAYKEKANFSKMLNGERPLKREFIIPIETIFGVSLAKLLNPDAYKLPTNKNDIPFNKGFRYYAYLDDPDLYIKEFDNILDKDGRSILNNTDEFGKTFLDYVVEYKSVNGIRYLHDEYEIKLKWYHNNFEFKKEKGDIWVKFDNGIEFARIVASMNDSELFYDIYDSYNMFFTNGHYGSDSCIFSQTDFLEIIMDNELLFKELFEAKNYVLKLSTRGKKKTGQESIEYYCANPLLNNCLRHALNNLNKYKKQAIDILKYGIKHNKEIKELNNTSYCSYNELGGLYDFTQNDKFIDLIIFVDVKEIKDDEVLKLVEELPEFNYWQ